jgi:hypothetical protein
VVAQHQMGAFKVSHGHTCSFQRPRRRARR